MADKISPLGVLDPLDVLENLAVQWAEFCQKTARLADRFAAVATEVELEIAVKEVVTLCQEYPYLALLLLQAGSKRPPAPTKELAFNPKEIANQYQDLLARLAANAQPESRGDGSRSHS